jgi:Phosphoribosylanthranilate isomerase
MMIKICGITNREDALAAIGGGASALGFNFYPGSPRYIDPAAAAEVAAGLPASVWKVGVFVNESSERMAEVARRVGLDIVQIVGQGIPLSGLRIWQTAYVNQDFRLADIESDPAEAILLDTPDRRNLWRNGADF